MLHFSKVKIFFILSALILGFLFSLPNALPQNVRENLPWPMPRNTLNLGLDLQGGAHMLLSVDLQDGLQRTLKVERDGIRDALRADGQVRANMRIEDDIIYLTFKSEADEEIGEPILEKQSVNVDDNAIGGGGKTLVIDKLGDRRFKIAISQQYLDYISANTIDQSIQVLRKRIDPTGTTEMTLAKEGKDRILLQVPGANNERVSEIKDRIRQTAKLTFNEVVVADSLVLGKCVNEGKCPLGVIFAPQKNGGQPLLIKEREVMGGSDLKSSTEGLSQQSKEPIVSSRFNSKGARKYCDYTAVHVGDRIAVVLDGEIITAPVIQSPICGGSGQISGNFTMQSARELALLLNAGALPAKLQIEYESTVGAELGKDSITAGKLASGLGLMGVGIFMWLSYGIRFGTIANIALATNIMLIAGALSIMGATLTLPGIAGIILTIGMAVDANVLIFERIREESALGRGPVNAVDTGYRLSLAPILDANITTLIAALTLYFVGSGPIRGFAVTLAIGIIMSVFTAVVVARLMTSIWLRRARPKQLPI
ncbi:MAG: protein translocase subunit SecD [Robiginitomaculum sp.]|nr:MAG: protein translocase subunit SecD [Robiginitomaculum sp.]